MRMHRFLVLAAIALAVAACKKDKEVNPPAELVDFRPLLATSQVWNADARGGDDVLRLGLRPAVVGERVYVAGHGGEVQALELASGRKLWQVGTKRPLSGGPAAGEGLVVVGTTDGDVVALADNNGAERWRVPVGGEVLAAPVIAAGIVVVRTVDGRLRGLSVADGKEAWVYEQPVPRLTLRGNGAPVVSGDMVIAGFDNGKVVAITLATGELLWSTTVAPAHGRTELERLVDIDSPVQVTGQDVYVVGYQGRIAMLALDSGQIWWGRELSSNRGLTTDASYLYVTLADSTVVALRRRDGTEVWRQAQLLNRSVTAPALVGEALVVGDYDGYVHWIDAITGDLLAREKSGGRITNTPVAAGDLLLFQTDSGKVEAWRAARRGSG